MLAEWKRPHAAAGQPPATAEVLKRLKIHRSCFEDRYLIANAVGVSPEQAMALAEETLREYDNLFRDRAASEDDAAVSDYHAVAVWVG